MQPDDFLLERYLAQYEFSAPHLLCTSDCEAMTVGDLLALCSVPETELADVWLGYTESTGGERLRRAIASLYTTVIPENLLAFTGAQEGIFACMNVLLRPGDHVIVQFPAYQSLYAVAWALGCDITFWEMSDATGEWVADTKELASLVRPETKAIVINSPHNPTGHHFTTGELDVIVDISRKNNLWLFSDEVYRGLEHDPADLLPAVADCYEKGISLGVMSKAFGLAGLRIGWVAARDCDLMARIAAFKDYTTICNSAPSEFLAALALEHRDLLLDRNRAIVRENLAILDDFFARHADLFAWSRPQASSTGFVRIREGGAEAFCREAIEAAGVLLLPSTVYEFGDAHFRVGYGRTDMPASLARFEAFLDERDG